MLPQAQLPESVFVVIGITLILLPKDRLDALATSPDHERR